VEDRLGTDLLEEHVERLADVVDVELRALVQVLALAGREVVDGEDLVTADDERVDDVGADEPGAACDYYTHCPLILRSL
jgi:hypothetical protein